jgi:tetratricopeptide (TPR) repeat protein
MTVDTAVALDRARMLAVRGSIAEARAVLDEILADDAAHVGALLLKASLLIESREEQEALVLSRRAAVVAPRSAEVLNGVARCLHALGRDDEAVDAARQALALLGEEDNFRHAAPVYLTLVWCLRQMRRYKEALALAEEGLARTPDAVLAQWASVVEEELAEAEKEEC